MSAFGVAKLPNLATVADALNELKSLRADDTFNVRLASVLARDLQGTQDLTAEGSGASAAEGLVGGPAGLPFGSCGSSHRRGERLIGASAELIDRQDSLLTIHRGMWRLEPTRSRPRSPTPA